MSWLIRTNLRLTFPGGAPLSHGKAELMELIRETGSIRQAAARMDMSYRRAWLLVDELNRMFSKPCVETKHGGKSGGGAALTAFGEELLRRFRAMETADDEGTESRPGMAGRRMRASGRDSSIGRRTRDVIDAAAIHGDRLEQRIDRHPGARPSRSHDSSVMRDISRWP